MATNPTTGQPGVKPGAGRLIVKELARVIVVGVILGALLFLPAGDLGWVGGWLLLGLYSAGMFLTMVALALIDPALAQERSDNPQNVKGWDKALTGLSKVLLLLVMPPLAGLDYRFGWSSGMPLAAILIGVAVFVLSFAITGWAMISNTFFAQGVRIQSERGHTVASGGPYRFVRHPGYVGMILSFLGAPILLGSWWTFIPAALAVATYVARTALEDRTLQEELPGYKEYAQQTHYRLIPGVW